MPIGSKVVITAAMNAQTRQDCKRDMVLAMLQSSGKLQLRVTGTSMLPTLWPGDLLTLTSSASEPLRLGEIVLFQRGEQLVVHRVVRLSSSHGQTGVTTRGDCMAEADAPIAAQDVLGRVTGVGRGPSMVVPSGVLSRPRKALGWLLCHCNLLSRIALRWHAARQRESGFTAPISEVTQ